MTNRLLRLVDYYFPDSLPLEERISAYMKASGSTINYLDLSDVLKHEILFDDIRENKGIDVSLAVAKKLLCSIGGTAEVQYIDCFGTEFAPIRYSCSGNTAPN